DQKGKYFRLNTANVHSDLAKLYITQAASESGGAQSVSGGTVANGVEVTQSVIYLNNREAAKRVRAKAEPHYRTALAIWEDVLKDDPDALADKYREAADFFWHNFADAATSSDLLAKASRLERSTGTPLLRKPIGPPNPGGDASINAQLAAEGAGYTLFNHDTSRAYGRPDTIRFAETLAAAWASRHPGLKLVVADISRQGGGPFPPHLDHQDGREVDIWPVTNNGQPEPTNIYAPNYSRDQTTELINLIKQTSPNAVVYFDDPPLVAAGLVRSTLDHNNYMHVLLP
ncbi:MAG TPA: penicillin-insensitive murein endopeptidase, partial [Pyrinomonadaceae bacterium]|nr:penicillin-insensitive murein endopeptidase [Pyrinomonadaceae bacterium]